jgi:MFS family permease
VVNYITSLMAAFIVNRVGRRKMFLFSTVSMFLTFSALTACLAVYNTHPSTASANGALGLVFIFYTCFNIGFNPLLYLYPVSLNFLFPPKVVYALLMQNILQVEILPYRIRAMGMSVLVFANKASLFFNQLVNPIAMDAMGWRYYCVYIGWLFVEFLVVFFFFPETKGYSLEEISEVFEGENAAAAKRVNEKEAFGTSDEVEEIRR